MEGCDDEDEERTYILNGTSWDLTGYLDSVNNLTSVVLPLDCNDSCYILTFRNDSVFGTFDNFNRTHRSFRLYRYATYIDESFEYLDLKNLMIEDIYVILSEEGTKYREYMPLVNKYELQDNILKLYTSKNLILIFSKR